MFWWILYTLPTFVNQDSWKSLKYLGMPNKALNSYFKTMEDSDTWTYDIWSTSTVFMNFVSNLAECLLPKLPNSLDKYNLESVVNCYSSFNTIKNDFCLNNTSEDKVLKIILKIEISKATSVDKHSEHPEVLSRLISEICHLLISRGGFPRCLQSCKAITNLLKRKEDRLFQLHT